MRKFPKPWFRASRNAWFVTLDGRQHELGPDRNVAFDLYRSLLAASPEQRDGSQRLALLIDRYLEWCSKHRAPDTYRFYRDLLQKFVTRYPALDVAQLRVYHVQDWIDSYDHLASGSKRNMVRALQRALHWCEEQGRIDRSPIAHMKKPRAGRRTTVVSPEEFERLLAYVSSLQFCDLITFAWHTGARAAECIAVERRHVDLPHARIIFPINEEKMERAPRVIYLNDEAREVVQRRLATCQDFLFTNSDDRPWTTESVNCQFEQIRIRMGMEALRARGFALSEDAIRRKIATLCPTRRSGRRIVPKSPAELREEARRKLLSQEAKRHAKKYCLTELRHSWCHHALRRGLDALTVSVLMGHADTSMVAKVYSHLSHAPQFLREQVQRTGSGRS